MIELRHIQHEFHFGQSNEVKAVDDVQLSIPEGQFVVLVGANGSGKSTLMNIIAGNILPRKGEIFIHGKNVSKTPAYNRSQWVARVFQNPHEGTAGELSIVENFRLAALRDQKKALKIGLTKEFEEQVKEKIGTLGLGLENNIHQSMDSLSGGQRQALCLLMATMTDLKILLLDEPTAALDPKSAELVMKIADRLIRENNITTIMVTHHLKDAAQYGDRVLQMKEGKVVKDYLKNKNNLLPMSEIYKWFES